MATWPQRRIRALDLEGNGFEIEADITSKLPRLGVRIVEAPIRYEAREEGKKLSPMDGFPTMLALLKDRRWRPPATSV